MKRSLRNLHSSTPAASPGRGAPDTANVSSQACPKASACVLRAGSSCAWGGSAAKNRRNRYRGPCTAPPSARRPRAGWGTIASPSTSRCRPSQTACSHGRRPSITRCWRSHPSRTRPSPRSPAKRSRSGNAAPSHASGRAWVGCPKASSAPGSESKDRPCARSRGRLRSVPTPSATAGKCGSGGEKPGSGNVIPPHRWTSATTSSGSPSTPPTQAGATPSAPLAVGHGGVLLRYGKTWTEETSLPAAAQGATFTGIVFAGSEAIVSYLVQPNPRENTLVGGLLVNDGSGWAVEQESVSAFAGGQPRAIAGLPDGGAAVLVEESTAGTRSSSAKGRAPLARRARTAAARTGRFAGVVSARRGSCARSWRRRAAGGSRQRRADTPSPGFPPYETLPNQPASEDPRAAPCCARRPTAGETSATPSTPSSRGRTTAYTTCPTGPTRSRGAGGPDRYAGLGGRGDHASPNRTRPPTWKRYPAGAAAKRWRAPASPASPCSRKPPQPGAPGTTTLAFAGGAECAAPCADGWTPASGPRRGWRAPSRWPSVSACPRSSTRVRWSGRPRTAACTRPRFPTNANFSATPASSPPSHRGRRTPPSRAASRKTAARRRSCSRSKASRPRSGKRRVPAWNRSARSRHPRNGRRAAVRPATTPSRTHTWSRSSSTTRATGTSKAESADGSRNSCSGREPRASRRSSWPTRTSPSSSGRAGRMKRPKSCSRRSWAKTPTGRTLVTTWPRRTSMKRRKKTSSSSSPSAARRCRFSARARSDTSCRATN